ncbi:MAG: hypothetical protein A3K59_09220 [Euryarchaeota archaeon RBG_19FT_COMBO_69_17]|nr:MAG: hypothetical protein A3K59_09220 [Euryarchaeota archaeon RBG_19FT_COMBO_69_17]
MKRSELLQRLEERLARGEISEATYLGIKARYDAEPEVPEAEAPSLETTIADAVARATTEASRAGDEASRAVGEAMRAVEFSGMGVRLSDEAIRIAGAGVVTGQPVRTRMFKSAGSARVQGDLEADETKVAGACAFEGSVTTDAFRSSGSVRVAKALTADRVESSGSLEVGEDLTADEVVSSGSLKVGGSLRADRLHASGSLAVAGSLVADDVTVELGGSSRVGDVHADEVRVKVTGGLLRTRGDLRAGTIHADSVYLEGTTANLVRGDRVTIGPHCRIQAVEAEELVVHESSEVLERRGPTTGVSKG